MVTREDFVDIPITDEVISQAKTHPDFRLQHHDSITGNRRNLESIIAEILISSFLDATHAPCFSFDSVKRTSTLEYKTKIRTVYPQTNYSIHVTATSTRSQRPDFYVFASIFQHRLTILGYIPGKEFMDRAVYVHKGQQSENGLWKEKADAWKLEIKNLYPIKDLAIAVYLRNLNT